MTDKEKIEELAQTLHELDTNLEKINEDSKYIAKARLLIRSRLGAVEWEPEPIKLSLTEKEANVILQRLKQETPNKNELKITLAIIRKIDLRK